MCREVMMGKMLSKMCLALAMLFLASGCALLDSSMLDAASTPATNELNASSTGDSTVDGCLLYTSDAADDA